MKYSEVKAIWEQVEFNCTELPVKETVSFLIDEGVETDDANALVKDGDYVLDILLSVDTMHGDTGADYEELLTSLFNSETDFEVDNYRFIKESEVLECVMDCYRCDTYVLGAFNDWFIAEEMGWPVGLVQAVQKGEAYSELGEAILSSGNFESMIESYINTDGVGHAMSSYDGNHEEITIDREDWVYFRVN